MNHQCPKCGGNSRIVDTQKRKHLNGSIRYRECKACSNRFQTIQRFGDIESIYQTIRKPSVRFTPKDIKHIRYLWHNTQTSSTKLAQMYDCSATSITRIVNYKVHAEIKWSAFTVTLKTLGSQSPNIKVTKQKGIVVVWIVVNDTRRLKNTN